MRLKILFCFLIFTVNFYCLNSEEQVRVNIVGYPKLEEFKIILNNDSLLFIDNVRYNYKKIRFINNEKKIICPDGEIKFFKNIDIKTNGVVVFDCIHGTQEYKGEFIISSSEKKLINILNIIKIDDYLASVLGSEMGPSFSDETLKAQAIAIRTYYYKCKKENKYKEFDINNADGMDMVYRGSSFATKKMYEALKITDNLFLVDDNDKLVLPLFHSTGCGVILKDKVMTSGFNDNFENPVLTYDTDINGNPLAIISPYFEFDLIIAKNDLINIISKEISINDIMSIKLKYFAGTECVDFIGFVDPLNDIHWLKGFKFVSYAHKNKFYKLRSIQFTINKTGADYRFKGRGFGHLCGMSQYSAENMARSGSTYLEILNKYYPDYKIKQIDIEKY